MSGTDTVTPFKNTHVVNLGSGTTFDVSSYKGYQKFSADNNFFFGNISYSADAGSGKSDQGYVAASGSNTVSKSYNTSPGVLSINGTSLSYSEDTYRRVSGHVSVSASVYLIY